VQQSPGMPHIPLEPVTRLSAFRRIALATWRTARDPTVYGSVTLRMDQSRAYMLAYREATGKRLTLTHMFAKAMAGMLETCPDVNVIRRWGRIYRRKDNVVMFQVAMEDPETGKIDLSVHTQRDSHEKDLGQVVDEFEASVRTIKKAEDPELERTRGLMKRLPTWLTGLVVEGLSFVMYTLNVDVSGLGFPYSPFGPVAVTNVGSLGIEEAFVPLVPYTKGSLVVALGAMTRTPVVNDDGSVESAWTVKLMATFDHRVLDGAHAAQMVKVIRAWMEDPYTHFGPIPADTEAPPPTLTDAEAAPGSPAETAG